MPLDTTSSGTYKVTVLACSSSGQRRIQEFQYSKPIYLIQISTHLVAVSCKFQPYLVVIRLAFTLGLISHRFTLSNGKGKGKLFSKEGITKCSNEVYNKFTNIRQHNNYLLDHIGYMFRPVNRSKHVAYMIQYIIVVLTYISEFVI